MIKCEDLNDVKITASIFLNKQLKNFRIDPKTDEQTLSVEVGAINEMKRRLGNEIKQKQNEIDIERQYQDSLPSNFRDNSKLDELKEHKDELKHKQKEMIKSYICGQYIIVVCGRHVKYAKIDIKIFNNEQEE